MIAPSDAARQHPDDPKIYVDVDGTFWRKINAQHPERRQWWPRKLTVEVDGYLSLPISRVTRRAHREVYLVHVGPLLKGLVVCHLNGVPSDNRVSNLLQATQAENMRHKRDHGTWQMGDNHPNAKVGSVDARRIKAALAEASMRNGRLVRGEAIRIAAELGVSVGAVRDIRKGGWAHV